MQKISTREEKNILKGLKIKYFHHEKRDRLIDVKRTNINDELFREYFKYQDPDYLLDNLNDTKHTERNKIQVNLIKMH